MVAVCGRLGLLHALAASLASSGSAALVKSSRIPIGEIAFICYLVIFAINLSIATSREESVFPKGQRLQLISFSLMTGFAFAIDYEATRLMPLGDEVAIWYTSVVFTIVLDRIFLSEPLGKDKLLSAAFVITGVVFISQAGSYKRNQPYPMYGTGLLLTLTGAFFEAATYIFIKGLSKLHYSVILTNCGWFTMLITGPMIFFENWTQPEEPGSLLAITSLTAVHEVLIYLAVKSGEQASLVSLLQASDMVFSYILEVTVFDEEHTSLRLLGAVMVACGVCLAAVTFESNGEDDCTLLPKEDVSNDTREPTRLIFVKAEL